MFKGAPFWFNDAQRVGWLSTQNRRN